MEAKKKVIAWENHKAPESWSLMELMAGATWESIAQLLLVFSADSFLTTIPNTWGLDGLGLLQLFLAILGMTFFQEVFLRRSLEKLPAEKRKHLIGLAVKVLLAAVIGFFLFRYAYAHFDELQQGSRALIHRCYEEYNRQFGTHLQISDFDQDELPNFLRIAYLSLYVLLFTLCRIGKRKWMILLFPIGTLCLLMSVGLTPSWVQMLICALGVYLLFHAQVRKHEGLRRAMILACVFTLLLLLFGAVFAKSAEQLQACSQQAKNFEKKLESNLKTAVSKVGVKKKGAVDTTAPHYRDAKVLTIRMDHAPEGNLYLQDFYGTDYANGEWTQSVSAFEAACREQGIDPQVAAGYLANSLYQLYEPRYFESLIQSVGRGFTVTANVKNAQVTDYKITYSGSFSKAMLLPYGADAADASGITYQGDAIAQKPGTQKETVFTGWNVNALNGSSLMVGKALLKEQEGFSQVNFRTEEENAFWDWYDAYVYETCMAYPNYVDALELKSYLKRTSSVSNADKAAMDYVFAENASSALTGPGSTYSWNLDKLEPGEDVMEHFFTHDRKGWCVHFASAGVFLLRSLGVPARYACGYVVTPSSFEEQEDGTFVAEVIDRNAHAWTEMYLEGIGWIPFEMTPGYSSASKELPTSQEAEEQRRKSEAASSEPQETETEPSEEKAPEESSQAQESAQESKAKEGPGGQGSGEGQEEAPQKKYVIGKEDGTHAEDGVEYVYVPLGKIFLMIGLPILLVFAVLLGVYGYRRAYVKKLDGVLKKRYYKAAVRIMNRRVYKKLRRRGKLRNPKATDRDLEVALLDTLGAEKKEEVSKYMKAVKAAAFSKGALAKEDCRNVWKIYKVF
ncbi:MAG: transglutaminase-like domain-containing protein [Acetatifactor sp.]|nr:transglutaminase-like domain-containing protein [Acetatifactor sp.]